MKIKDLIAEVNPEPVAITVPSWGDAEVYVLPPSRDTLDEHDDILRASEDDAKSDIAALYFLVSACLREKDGSRAFDSAEELEEATRNIPFDGLGEIYQCARSRQMREVAKVKGAEKNLKTRRKR